MFRSALVKDKMRMCLILIISMTLQQVVSEDVLYLSRHSLPPMYEEYEYAAELELPEEDDDAHVGSRKIWHMDNNTHHDHFLSLNELDEFEDALTVFDNYEFHSNGYDPLFVNPTNSRVRRSADGGRAQMKQKLKELLQKAIKKLRDAQKIKTPEVIRENTRDAIDLINEYYGIALTEQQKAADNALQIIKSDDDVILLANCGGVWYPIKDTMKVLRCESSRLKFQERFHQTINICDDYICEKTFV